MGKTVILGTAGHIDHGKTTLVKALTGINTDRLKEEQERGITIELGFAHLDLPSGIRVGVVDVPGHERFVKNMVAGATGMDLVALVIAADEGVMPQTREHMEICQLLGVKKGLVVITKTDLVDQEWIELVTEDVKGFIAGTFLEDASILAVSSTTGSGLDRLVSAMDAIAREIPERRTGGPYRLPVDRVFTVKGFGTVVTGTSVSGEIHLGDEVTVYPKGLSVRIRGIQTHGTAANEAKPGVRTALNLQGIDRDEIQRGDVVATPDSLRPSQLLDLKFLYLKSAGRPLRHRSPVRFHTGTAEIMGRILFSSDEVNPGDETYAQIMLEGPVAVLPGDHYVIRSYSPIHTIGGGRVLNPLPRKRKRTRPELWEEMKVLDTGQPGELVVYHLENAGVRGLAPREISIRTGLFGKTLERHLNELLSAHAIVRFEGEGRRYLARSIYDALLDTGRSLLAAYHRENPLVPGIPKEELKTRIFRRNPDPRLFQKVLADLVESGIAVMDRDLVRLSTHEVALGEQDEAVKGTIETIYRNRGLEPPSRDEAIGQVKGRPQTAGRILDLLVRNGVLVKVKDDLLFHREAMEGLQTRLVEFLREKGEIGITEFRDLTGGVSRKYMIPLLEYFDAVKVTLRVGDKRRLRG